MTTSRILVVDDEPHVVKSCARILELEGFEAVGITNGAEALPLYQRERFDLVLLDLKMPGTDGLEVLEALKEYDPGSTVVIITAYGSKENVVKALRLGAREFLEKPLDTGTLLATVRRILDRKNGETVRGNLRTLSLPSIIQINCTECNQARLRIRRQGREGNIFFANGNIVHATLGSKIGEEAVYELLTWEDGDFELEMGTSSPENSITVGWSGLLLEGLRRIDERAARWDGLDDLEQHAHTEDKEVKMTPKKRSEQLADALSALLSRSSDIEGGALVGIDGLVLSANIPVGKLDETLVGATAAAIAGMSRRSIDQMQRGEFFQALIQGSKGNIIVTFVDERNVFVGLTPADVNLGMAFHEARQVAQELAAIMRSETR